MTRPLRHTSPPGAPLWQLVPISTHATPGEGAVSPQLSITAPRPGATGIRKSLYLSTHFQDLHLREACV